MSCVLFFFFKQKTAYEMRISDWSSDVCSSDLPGSYQAGLRQLLGQRYGQPDNCLPWASIADLTAMLRAAQTVQIRRSVPRGHNPSIRTHWSGPDGAARGGRWRDRDRKSVA